MSRSNGSPSWYAALQQWRTGQGDLGIASSFRFKLKEFRDEYLVSEAGPVPFGGRDLELDSLDRWLISPSRPSRLLLAAPAGRGKSALIVHWLDKLDDLARNGRSDWQIAFMPISIRVGTNRPDEFYQGLALRLSEISDEPLAETRQRDADYFKAAVRQQFEIIARKGIKVLAVLDGIDEALEGTFDAAVLPRALPPTLRVLISARWQVGDEDATGWLTRFGWDRDLRAETMELKKLDAAHVADVLVRLGAPIDVAAREPGLIERLAVLTDGEPLLVRYYCGDLWDRSLTGARITVTDLDTLRPGFGSYFQRWLEQQEKLWRAEGTSIDMDEVFRVMLILAHAKGRLPEADLLALIENVYGEHRVAYAGALLRPLRRFVMGDGKRETGFVLSHPKIGSYLRAELFHAREKALQDAFVDWGRKHVAAVNSGEIGRDEASTYLLDHISSHLEAVGAAAADFMSMVEDGWRQALERRGGHGAFADATKCAWAACRRAGSDSELGAQWRCALVIASLSSLGASIPGALLVLMVRKGVLSALQARRYCEIKGPTEDTVAALSMITLSVANDPRAAREMAQTALVNALAVWTIDPSYKAFAQALHRIRPDLVVVNDKSTTPTVERSPKTGIWISHKPDLSIADSGVRSENLADAVSAAAQTKDLVDLLAAVDVLAKAADANFSFRSGSRQSMGYRIIQNKPFGDDDTFENAFTRALAIQDELDRSGALLSIARRISDRAQLSKVFSAACSIRDEKERAIALSTVANHVKKPSERAAILAEAAKIARGATDAQNRADALTFVLERLDNGTSRAAILRDALAAAYAVEEIEDRLKALSALSNFIEESSERNTFLNQMLSQINALASEGVKARALATLAESLTSCAHHATAMSAALSIADGWHRSWALAAMVEHLTHPEHLAIAVSAAKEFENGWHRSWALAAIADKLGNALLMEDALTAARGIACPLHRSWAITAIAQRCNSAAPRIGALSEAFEAARLIPEEGEQSRLLSVIASCTQDSALLSDTMVAARSFSRRMDRVVPMMAATANFADPQLHAAALTEVLREASELSIDNHVEILAGLAERSTRANGSEIMAQLIWLLASMPRANALEAAAKTISLTESIGGQSAVDGLRRAIADVGRWYP